MKNRSEKVIGQGQILTILKGQVVLLAEKSGELWIGQTLLQLISFKSDRFLGIEIVQS